MGKKKSTKTWDQTEWTAVLITPHTHVLLPGITHWKVSPPLCKTQFSSTHHVIASGIVDSCYMHAYACKCIPHFMSSSARHLLIYSRDIWGMRNLKSDRITLQWHQAYSHAWNHWLKGEPMHSYFTIKRACRNSSLAYLKIDDSSTQSLLGFKFSAMKFIAIVVLVVLTAVATKSHPPPSSSIDRKEAQMQ